MNKIGFTAEKLDLLLPYYNIKETPQHDTFAPRKSLVQVRFVSRNITLSYYNDLYNLHCGDYVYVEGKMEGLRGLVVDVNYHFKVKLSDYKKVIYLVDTDVSGTFHMAGSHFVTFDRNTLPYAKALTWFRTPTNSEEELYVSGSDGESFPLYDLSQIKITKAIAERGHDYYSQNKVVYLCVDEGSGKAIIEGTQAYEVEFTYRNGLISDFFCSCPCSYNCKHEFAAMLQLKETLDIISKNYEEDLDRTDYFAIIRKSELFTFAVVGKENGSFTL